MPRPKLRLRSTRTLTPSTETVSRSSVPARMRSPEPGAVQDQEQRQHHRRDQHHHEHAIAGEEEELAAQRRGEPVRNLEGQALRAPDEARAVLDHEGKAEGQQQAVERIAPIEPADQHALDQRCR